MKLSALMLKQFSIKYPRYEVFKLFKVFLESEKKLTIYWIALFTLYSK